MSGFDYNLPKNKIAQQPVSSKSERSSSKLLYARFSKNSPQKVEGQAPTLPNKQLDIADKTFQDISEILRPTDLLVLNNTKVLKRRFFIQTPGKQEKSLELFLLEELVRADLQKMPEVFGNSFGTMFFKALANPMASLLKNMEFNLSNKIIAKVLGRTNDQRFLVLELRLEKQLQREGKKITEVFAEFEEEKGFIPIPPYIRKGISNEEDNRLYQTVYAEVPGSIAAPTAGLHFTPELISKLTVLGVEIAPITLHVGTASIMQIDTALSPGLEKFSIEKENFQKILAAKKAGRRVVAVGTTTVRTLETIFLDLPKIEKYFLGNSQFAGETGLFIEPGFNFKAVDVLITNFHQPKSTHLSLVAAFIGRENLNKVYNHALKSDYRFLSYGDSMCLEPAN